MYSAYHDSILSMNDIRGFGIYELSILKNLIFAKHNYTFSKEFYQAYFNLFTFYDRPKKQKTPTKDNHRKLTPADHKNLKRIITALKKTKKKEQNK